MKVSVKRLDLHALTQDIDRAMIGNDQERMTDIEQMQAQRLC